MTSPRSIRLSLIARSGDIVSPVGRLLDGPRAQKRSDQAVNADWQEHLDVVYRYALRLTRDTQRACDLTQETMLRGLRKQSALREPAAARVWLLRIATNIWTDWLRRDVHRPRLLKQDSPSGDPTSPEKLIHQENVMAALAALDELPPRQRQVMHLITVEQMSHEDVAGVLGITVAAVKSSLSAGRKELRERLRDIYEDVCGGTQCRASE